MTTKEAIHKAVDGFKIRRKCWSKELYFFFDFQSITFYNQKNFVVTDGFSDADDWEIYE